MNYIKTILILLTAIFFISCGSDEDITVSGTTDISHIKINENNGTQLYVSSTETLLLTATVFYKDGTSSDATHSVKWLNSNYTLATLEQNLITPIANFADMNITASYKDSFSDTINIKINRLTNIKTVPHFPITTTGSYYLSAFGTFEDNTTKDVTSHVAWSSDNYSNIIVYYDIPVLFLPATGNTTVYASIYDINTSTIFTVK